jgi:hypothetical protein
VQRAQRRFAEAIPEYEAVLALNRNSVFAISCQAAPFWLRLMPNHSSVGLREAVGFMPIVGSGAPSDQVRT